MGVGCEAAVSSLPRWWCAGTLSAAGRQQLLHAPHVQSAGRRSQCHRAASKAGAPNERAYLHPGGPRSRSPAPAAARLLLPETAPAGSGARPPNALHATALAAGVQPDRSWAPAPHLLHRAEQQTRGITEVPANSGQAQVVLARQGPALQAAVLPPRCGLGHKQSVLAGGAAVASVTTYLCLVVCRCVGRWAEQLFSWW